MQDSDLESIFPLLSPSGYSVESPKDRRYNCIAWAAGINDRWWWPNSAPDADWPKGVPNEITLDAFIAAFQTLGFKTCFNGDLEDGVEKVVFYAIGGKPTHAARQLTDGKWWSKCGGLQDIFHTLEGLSGIFSHQSYGHPTAFMSRPRR